MDRFISEHAIDAHKRQEAAKRDPHGGALKLVDPKPYDSRTLFERLEDQMRKQEEGLCELGCDWLPVLSRVRNAFT